MRAARPRIVTWPAGVLAATLVSGGTAAGLEGELSALTREKLRHRVTFREKKVNLEALIPALVEETGLSVVAPLEVVHMPEPVAIVANDVTVEELVDTVAFALRLEVLATANGVIAFRLPEDDPRREATLRRYRGPRWREGDKGGPPPRFPAEEVIERVSHNPEIRDLLARTGARLFPGEFLREKRVWVLQVRRADEKLPVARVFASEDGEVVGLKKAREEGKGEEEDERRPHDKRRKEHF